jgi:uncharacterized protein (DUF488 family)
MAEQDCTILTIGHSTRELDEFFSLLKAHEVEHLVDVRSVPRSRRNPQFNRETFGKALGRRGLGYTHEPSLGGLRKTRADSPNTGWRNASFRGYADYMQTDEFADGIARLVELGRRRRVAIMCAEAVPWRCHRSLIADALTVRGFGVEHILGRERRMPHTLTDFAVVDGQAIHYPSGEQRAGDMFA